jgi:O-antigen/teichoic acid export membrane protein
MIESIKLKLKNNSAERSGIINMCLKPVSAILSLIYIPLLLVYLGDEKYGLWATLLSIITWVNYFDVGIGNGLRNLLTKELSLDEKIEAQKTVSTGYIVLSCIAIALYICLLIMVFVINWKSVFSTDIDMRPALWVSFSFICFNFILALSNSVLYALQLSERVSLRNCIVQALNIIGLLLIREITSENLIAIAVLFGATSSIVYISNTLQILRKLPFLKPRIKHFDKLKIKMICNTGVKFFVIQIMCLLLFSVDNILITHLYGAQNATPFSIADKVFQTVYSFLAAFLVPYWSRTTQAMSHNDVGWIKNSIKKTSALCALFTIGYFLVFLIFKPVVTIWLQKELQYPDGLTLIMFVFYSLYSILAVECQFINGTGKINTQLAMYIFIGIANIPLSIFLAVYADMGIFGIRLATTILVFIAIIILGVNLIHIIKDLEKKNKNMELQK